MLFLVVAPERGARRDHRPVFLCRGYDQGGHRVVYVGAIAEYLFGRGTRQQAATRARVRVADLLVIGIEQVLEVRMKWAITGRELFE